MAGQTCAIVTTQPNTPAGSRYWEIEWTWLSDAASNDVNVTTPLATAIAGSGALGGPTPPVTDPPFTGVALRCICIPDAGGTQPTNLYDITIEDKDGVDILHGNGADRSNAIPDDCVGYVSANALVAVNLSTLALTVAAAGAAKGGIVRLILTM